jgi:peptidoglycan/LPS O-acetylase OafA/YrhL
MSFEFYKIIHLLGIALLFLGFGSLLRGSKDQSPRDPSAAIIHGLGTLFLLISGFGMLAKLELHAFPWPYWVMIKLILWVMAGGLIAPILRKRSQNKLWWALVILIGFFAAYLGVTKPI